MKIINLMEDTEGSQGCLHEHGLSFYLETDKHRLLMDTGATSAFLQNADRLGIDVTKVDTVIISHGHYDHAGGVLAFSEKNPTAVIYMQATAGEDYYHLKEKEEKYIGIRKEILELPQLCLLTGSRQIDEELSLFSEITGRKNFAKSNVSLKRKTADGYEQDSFQHEQCLVVQNQGKHILLSGCAHNGILNILERYQEIYHDEPAVVISGFHMAQKATYTPEDIANIQDTAYALTKYNSRFYTGHCTGREAYRIMKEIMGEQLQEIHSGDCVDML